MRIGLLSGAYPPAVDGIGDYTHFLASELSSLHNVTVFTGSRNFHEPDQRIRVQCVFDPDRPATIQNLSKIMAADPGFDRFVVQYNPFGFGPRGFNPWLPLTLFHLRKRFPVSIMFHETYVPCESISQLLMRVWQIPQFVSLCRMADPLYASCSRWLPAIRRASGRDAVVLPAGSNIRRSHLSREESRTRMGIGSKALVFGVFGSAHPSRLMGWISAAANSVAARVPEATLVYIGADGEKLRRGLDPKIRFMDCGVLAGDDVGDHLVSADCMLAPFVDGLSTRRGSVIAAFQHGIPVISTSSIWTDDLLLGQEKRAIFLSPVHDGIDGFASLAARISEQLPFPYSRHIALREFHEQHFAWPSISRRLTG